MYAIEVFVFAIVDYTVQINILSIYLYGHNAHESLYFNPNFIDLFYVFVNKIQTEKK